MVNIFKNFGKTIVVFGSTTLQLIALILRFISLIFETIGWVFRMGSVMLTNVSTYLLGKVGFMKEKKLGEADT